MTETMENEIFSLAENGVITTQEVSNRGIRRSALSELVAAGKLVQCSRGIYMIADDWEDEFFLLQKRYSRGIFSHATALYLLGYSERVPLRFHMTFVQNYNSPSLKEENVTITRVKPEFYEMGIVMKDTPSGNQVHVYNIERSLCDMLRGTEGDIQSVQYAMKKYILSDDRDINRLMEYARLLHVEKKVRNYVEVLL